MTEGQTTQAMTMDRAAEQLDRLDTDFVVEMFRGAVVELSSGNTTDFALATAGGAARVLKARGLDVSRL